MAGPVSDIPLPGLRVVAEGDLGSGEHWVLTIGGTADDYYTLLKTVYPDGKCDEGGFGGPALYPGSVLNTYTGVRSRGLRLALARTATRVDRVRLELVDGTRLELRPVAFDATLDLAFFAAFLPPTAVAASMVGLDADGHELTR
jgi:hypothetical protein